MKPFQYGEISLDSFFRNMPPKKKKENKKVEDKKKAEARLAILKSIPH